MALPQGQQDIAAAGEQGHIALAEQHHRPPLDHFLGQPVGGVMPGLPAGLGRRHHREHQRQPPLARHDPGFGHAGRHAHRPFAGNRIGHGVGGFDGAHRSDGEQVRITGSHPNQGEAGAGCRVGDGAEVLVGPF